MRRHSLLSAASGLHSPDWQIFFISVFYTALELRGTSRKERFYEKLFSDSLSVQIYVGRLDYFLITGYLVGFFSWRKGLREVGVTVTDVRAMGVLISAMISPASVCQRSLRTIL